VIDVLPHLSELVRPPSMKNHWSDSRTIETPFPTVTSQSVKQIRINTDGCGSSNSRRANSVDSDVDKPMKTLHRNKPSIRQFKLEALGANSNRIRDREISQPSKTICGSGNQTGARIFNHTQPKPEKIRSLTIQETLILQGFSPDYDMTAANTQKARWTMIGNAVVPAVAKAVIEGIECR
jgi:site-specific DNA-cytosine methylase